jgi:hypothetical protein
MAHGGRVLQRHFIETVSLSFWHVFFDQKKNADCQGLRKQMLKKKKTKAKAMCNQLPYTFWKKPCPGFGKIKGSTGYRYTYECTTCGDCWRQVRPTMLGQAQDPECEQCDRESGKVVKPENLRSSYWNCSCGELRNVSLYCLHCSRHWECGMRK